ncbi:MAG: hypothetical protein ACLFPF_11030 [Halanaerobiales bacterium]
MKSKRNIKLYIISIALFISLFLITNPGVEASQLTARSYGMGGAFTAVADDVEAILYNPAGITDNGYVGLDFNMGMNILNVDELEKVRDIADSNSYEYINEKIDDIDGDISLDNQLFFGAKFSSIGLAYNIKESHLLQNNSGSDNSYLSSRVSEAIFSYGNDILEPPLEIGALSYGVNVKLVDMSRNNYYMESSREINIKGNGYGLDIGLLSKVTDTLKLGCVVENLLASDIDLDGQSKRYIPGENGWQVDQDSIEDYSETADFDPNVRVGAALDVPVLNMILAADIDNLFDQNDTGQVLHFGLEKDFVLNSLTVRAGRVTGDSISLTTLGFGVNLSGASIDLAIGEESNKDDLSIMISADINY